jgi:hypothetical protein
MSNFYESNYRAISKANTEHPRGARVTPLHKQDQQSQKVSELVTTLYHNGSTYNTEFIPHEM